MRILYIDAIYQPGHKNFNSKMISAFSKLGEVDVLYHNKNIVNENAGTVKNSFPIKEKFYYKKKFFYKLIYRLKYISMWKWVTDFINRSDYDFYFISYIESVSFALGTKKIRKNCGFVDHLYGQTVANKTKFRFFKKINANLKAGFMEKYICEFAKNAGCENAFYFPHPLINGNFESCPTGVGAVIAPGGNNDEAFISQLVSQSVKLDDRLSKKLIIKGQKDFESQKLKIYSGKLSDSEYSKLMSESSAFLLIYNDDYNLRTSGVFYEAIALNKIVYLRDNNTMKKINEQFENVVKCFNTVDELIDLINGDNSFVDYSEIKREHSEESVAHYLKVMIESDNERNHKL